MVSVFIENLHYKLDLVNRINSIKIENVEYYRDLYYNFSTILSIYNEDNKLDDNSIYVINNPLDIDLNSTKNLNNLYKYLQKICKEDENIILNEIDSLVNKLFFNIIENTNFNFEYDNEVSLSKLMSTYHLRFNTFSNENYIDNLILVIKAINEIFNINVFISFNLSSFLSKQEFETFNKELSILDCYVIDFCYHNKNSNWNLIIDDNLDII